MHGSERLRNADLHRELTMLARRIDFEWLRKAVEKTDELVDLQRRNVQKGLSLDRFVVTQRWGLG